MSKLVGAGAVLSIAIASGCAGPATSTASDEGMELRAIRPDEVVGAIGLGETKPITYTGTPQYVAMTYEARSGDTIQVATKKRFFGGVDPDIALWLTLADGTVLHGPGWGALSPHRVRTADRIYIVARHRTFEAASFELELTGAPSTTLQVPAWAVDKTHRLALACKALPRPNASTERPIAFVVHGEIAISAPVSGRSAFEWIPPEEFEDEGFSQVKSAYANLQPALNAFESPQLWRPADAATSGPAVIVEQETLTQLALGVTDTANFKSSKASVRVEPAELVFAFETTQGSRPASCTGRVSEPVRR